MRYIRIYIIVIIIIIIIIIIMWSIDEISHFWTAVVDESEKWSSQ